MSVINLVAGLTGDIPFSSKAFFMVMRLHADCGDEARVSVI